MVQSKKAFNNSKPKFAEVVIGDSEAKEMRVAANGRPSRSPYLKLVYPNGVTLILPADTSVECSFGLIEMPIDNTDGENGAFPPTRDGCIHSLSMRKRG